MQHMYDVNGVVTLGSYPCSEFGMKAPIEWIVLSRQPDTVLLVSRCALDGQPFHTNGQRMIFDPETRRIQARGEEASWERSSLYTWLNTDFYLSTFTPKERECILPADTPYRAGSGKLGHVFLLGVDEVNALFVSDESACCAPTPYARTRYEDSTEELRQQQAMSDAPLPARATYWLLSGKAACNQVPGARGPIVFALDQTEKRAVRPAILLDVRKHQALVEATRNAPGSASRRAAYQPPQPEAEPIAMPRQNLLGLLALDPANWVPIVTDMAEKDQPDAQMHLCSLYREGSGGLPQDPARSLEWCRRAADNGLAIAQALMGTHYYNGDGVPMDKREAVRWYRLAAEQGLAPAQGDLADCYLTGSGVPQDYAQAAHWFGLSAEAGYPLSMRAMGILYQNGLGVEASAAKAYGWFLMAANAGDAEAMMQMYQLKRDGVGTSADPAAAQMWLERAAERKFPNALYRLGLETIVTDPEKAAVLIQEALDVGYVPACVLLGHLYLDGVGVEKDRRKALELLMLGKRHGVYGANYFLGEYYMQEGELHLALKHFEAAVADGDDSAREQVDMLRAMLS